MAKTDDIYNEPAKDGKVRSHQGSISCLGGSPRANLKLS